MQFRFFALACVVLVVAATACSSKPPDDTADYTRKLAAARAQKDADFQSAADGDPIPTAKRAEFLPLAYFPIDDGYRVPAVLRPAETSIIVQMPTSTGETRQMRRVGSLEFSLKGRPLKLAAFVEVGSPNLDHLFVPFTDLTSGTETYPAGRYLDLDRNATGIYVVDFNRAYHRYLLFQPDLRLPVSACRESPADANPPRASG